MLLLALLACGPAQEPTSDGGLESLGPRKAVDTSQTTGDTGSTSLGDTSAPVVDTSLVDSSLVDTSLVDTSLVDTAGLDTAGLDTAGLDTAQIDTGSTTDTGPFATFDVPDFLAGGWILFSPDPNTCVTVTDDTIWISDVTSTGFVADLGAGHVVDCELQWVDLSTEAADFTCHYFLAETVWGGFSEVTIDITASVLSGEGSVVLEVEHELLSLYTTGCTDMVSGYIVQL